MRVHNRDGNVRVVLITATCARRDGRVSGYSERESGEREFGDRDQRRSCAVSVLNCSACESRERDSGVRDIILWDASDSSECEFGNHDSGVRLQHS